MRQRALPVLARAKASLILLIGATLCREAKPSIVSIAADDRTAGVGVVAFSVPWDDS
jgi:hypothetical protein